MAVIFVACAYSGDTPEQVHLNVAHAMNIAQALVVKGHVPFIPHLNHFWHLHMLTRYGHSLEYEEWMRQTLTMVERCNSMYYEPSPGANRELIRAQELARERSGGYPIYRSVEEVPCVNS